MKVWYKTLRMQKILVLPLKAVSQSLAIINRFYFMRSTHHQGCYDSREIKLCLLAKKQQFLAKICRRLVLASTQDFQVVRAAHSPESAKPAQPRMSPTDRRVTSSSSVGMRPAIGCNGAVAKAAQAAADESARQSMVDMGFSSVDITAALERENRAFGPALIQVLNGLDEDRTKTDNKQSNRFRRQCFKCVPLFFLFATPYEVH